MTKKDLFKEMKSLAIIISIIVVLFLFISLFNSKTFQNIFLFPLVVYISMTVLFHFLGSILKSRHFDKFTTILSFPIGIIYAILTALIPLIGLLLHTMLYFVISFLIPEIIYLTLNSFHLIDSVTTQTIVYLKITLTVFISVLLNPLLRDIIYRISPMRLKTSEKHKPYEFDKLSDYFLSTDNIRFFVYGLYVIALLTTNFYYFQGDSITNSIDIDKSILQSFVAFIAFDRTFVLMKQLNLKPSILLTKINQSISIKSKTEATDEKTSTNK